MKPIFLSTEMVQAIIKDRKTASLYDPLKYNKKGDDSRNKMDFIENIIKDLKETLK